MVTQRVLSHSAPVDIPSDCRRLFDFEDRQRIYRADEQLFTEGDSAFFVYKVLRGIVRSSRSLANGIRSVDAFSVAGDLVGLDFKKARAFTAEAITDVFVSVARLDIIFVRPAADGDAAQELLAATSLELQRTQRRTILLAMKARQRVASFLLEMSERLGQQEIVDLPMPRQDIADYLGLTIETVSRVLMEFDRTYLTVSRSSRRIALLDPPALRRMAELGRGKREGIRAEAPHDPGEATVSRLHLAQ